MTGQRNGVYFYRESAADVLQPRHCQQLLSILLRQQIKDKQINMELPWAADQVWPSITITVIVILCHSQEVTHRQNKTAIVDK